MEPVRVCPSWIRRRFPSIWSSPGTTGDRSWATTPEPRSTCWSSCSPPGDEVALLSFATVECAGGADPGYQPGTVRPSSARRRAARRTPWARRLPRGSTSWARRGTATTRSSSSPMAPILWTWRMRNTPTSALTENRTGRGASIQVLGYGPASHGPRRSRSWRQAPAGAPRLRPLPPTWPHMPRQSRPTSIRGTPSPTNPRFPPTAHAARSMRSRGLRRFCRSSTRLRRRTGRHTCHHQYPDDGARRSAGPSSSG